MQDLRNTKIHFSLLLGIIFSLLCVPAPLSAGTTGILEGSVKDKDNNTPLIGATIVIVGTSMGRATDINGKFNIYNLPAGKISVRVQMIGYKSMLFENVQINSDLKTRLNILMTASSVQLGETVVEAERPALQHDVLGTTHTVSGQDMKILPVTTFQEVMSFKPGTTVEGNVRGGKTTEVLYLIDGLPAQDVMAGGSGADLPNSSIVELSMQTGGFEAEYGNAQSGVVNVITKSGSNEFDAYARISKDDLYGGTQVSHETEAEAASSGPIIPDNLFYFFSVNYSQSGTRWWQDFQHFYSLPIEKTWSGMTKLDYTISSYMRLSTQFLFSSKEWNDYEFSWRFNLKGLPARKRETIRAAAIFTHTLSENTYYSLRFSGYQAMSTIGLGSKGTLDPTRIYDYDFYLQYITGGEKLLWSRTTQKIFTMKGDFTSQIFSIHFLKIGGEFNFYGLESDVEKYEPKKTYFGKPLPLETPLNFSSQYRFFPKSGMAYLQDKFTVDRATISLGVRYDFLNPTAKRPAFELVPTSPNQYRLRLSYYVPAKFKYQISPRIGFSVPFSEDGYVFVNYGYYFQFPLFDYLYSGLDVAMLQRGSSALMGNPNLDPERTKAWEISVKQVLLENVVGSFTYFRKESANLIDTKTFVANDSKAAGDFGFVEYVNNPYAESNGIEFVVSRNVGAWLTGDVSYSYMKALGLSDNTNQGLNYKQWGFTPVVTPFYLSWDQRHTIKANLNAALPYDFSVNLFYHYHSARPYTYFPSRDGYTPTDPTQEFIPNNERMSDFQNVDIKFMKSFGLDFGRSTLIILYVDARNILNRRNVKWTDSSGKIGGELEDPAAYYMGRRVKTGLRVEVDF